MGNAGYTDAAFRSSSWSLPGRPLRHRLPPCLSQPHQPLTLVTPWRAPVPPSGRPGRSRLAHLTSPSPCLSEVMPHMTSVFQMRTPKCQALPSGRRALEAAGLRGTFSGEPPVSPQHDKGTRAEQWPDCSSREAVRPDEAGGHSLAVTAACICARHCHEYLITLARADLIFASYGRCCRRLQFAYGKTEA